MSYNPTLAYLYNLQKHGIRPGLERMQAFLSVLGHPHLLFPSIHIGGTNGKGSTAAMVARILRQAGYSVGLYTSPHLIDLTERITINGVPIPKEAVVTGTERLRRQSDAAFLSLTFFEFITALAFCYFAEAAVDIAVIEVGLGGRFDATSVLSPQVTAITQVDLDHQQYLGDTICKIAFEKAGIIKEGVPVITGVTQPEAIHILEERARVCNAPLMRLGQDITVSGNNPFIYRGGKERTISCPLLGRHQRDNAGIAIGIIEALQASSSHRLFSISENDIHEGIRRVEWPGRLQQIKSAPRILLDGAHNPAGARALASYLQTVDPAHAGRHRVMAGILRDKDSVGILDPLTEWADEWIFTQPDVERATDAWQLRVAQNKPATVQVPVTQAIAYAESKLQSRDTLVITGSLYTVGEALAYFTGVVPSSIRG